MEKTIRECLPDVAAYDASFEFAGKNNGEREDSAMSFHLVLCGASGTGKTRAARDIGKACFSSMIGKGCSGSGCVLWKSDIVEMLDVKGDCDITMLECLLDTSGENEGGAWDENWRYGKLCRFCKLPCDLMPGGDKSLYTWGVLILDDLQEWRGREALSLLRRVLDPDTGFPYVIATIQIDDEKTISDTRQFRKWLSDTLDSRDGKNRTLANAVARCLLEPSRKGEYGNDDGTEWDYLRKVILFEDCRDTPQTPQTPKIQRKGAKCEENAPKREKTCNGTDSQN